jgi:hypothetical protein
LKNENSVFLKTYLDIRIFKLSLGMNNRLKNSKDDFRIKGCLVFVVKYCFVAVAEVYEKFLAQNRGVKECIEFIIEKRGLGERGLVPCLTLIRTLLLSNLYL